MMLLIHSNCGVLHSELQYQKDMSVVQLAIKLLVLMLSTQAELHNCTAVAQCETKGSLDSDQLL